MIPAFKDTDFVRTNMFEAIWGSLSYVDEDLSLLGRCALLNIDGFRCLGGDFYFHLQD